jgi:lysozyme
MVDYATFIMAEEGFRQKPYKCSQGKTTIGIGRNLDDVGLSSEEVMYLFENDQKKAVKEASELVNEFEYLSDARKIALVSMVFQLGKTGVSKFKNMIDAINKGEFHRASNEMMDSLWATQTPERAQRQADMVRTGKDAL